MAVEQSPMPPSQRTRLDEALLRSERRIENNFLLTEQIQTKIELNHARIRRNVLLAEANSLACTRRSVLMEIRYITQTIILFRPDFGVELETLQRTRAVLAEEALCLSHEIARLRDEAARFNLP